MIPTIPDHAPFSREQRSWLNGFFAGLYSVQEADPAPLWDVAKAPSNPAVPVTVLFASQTGTAESLARKAAKKLNGQGFAATVNELDAVSAADLVEVQHLLVVTSTHGDGEMPDNAQSFWDALTGDEAPHLELTKYSVCALGDSSYPDFCQAGKDLDARLEALGAERFHPRVDCDVDFDEPFATWLDGVQRALAAPSGDGAIASAQIQERA